MVVKYLNLQIFLKFVKRQRILQDDLQLYTRQQSKHRSIVVYQPLCYNIIPYKIKNIK